MDGVHIFPLLLVFMLVVLATLGYALGQIERGRTQTSSGRFVATPRCAHCGQAMHLGEDRCSACGAALTGAAGTDHISLLDDVARYVETGPRS